MVGWLASLAAGLLFVQPIAERNAVCCESGPTRCLLWVTGSSASWGACLVLWVRQEPTESGFTLPPCGRRLLLRGGVCPVRGVWRFHGRLGGWTWERPLLPGHVTWGPPEWVIPEARGALSSPPTGPAPLTGTVALS